MSRSKKVIVVIMLLVPALFRIEPAFAEIDRKLEAEMEREQQHFDLFVNCKPVVLIVEDLPKDAQKIRITKKDIRMAVESRLRSARIYGFERMSPLLGVSVNIVGRAFHVEIELAKYVHDSISQSDGFATTWSRGTTGISGQDSGFILSTIAMIMDEFIVEYFRENEKACEQE